MVGKGSFGDELLTYLELLPVTTIIVRVLDARIIWANPAHIKLIGAKDPSEVVGKRVLDFIPPEQHGVAMRNAALFVAGARYVPPYVYALKCLDGTTLDAHIESTLIEFNGVLSMLTLIVDVSERERALSSLAESEERYRSLVETSPDAIIVCVLDDIVYANQEAMRLTGARRPKDLLGRSLLSTLHPEYAEASLKRLRSVYAEGGILPTVESAVVDRNGNVVPVELRTALISWQGAPATQTIIRDISKRKANEEEIERYRNHLEQLVDERTLELEGAMQELETMNEDLVRANEAKNAFMAAMSHELRTPLNSIIGFSAILRQGLAGGLNDEQEKQVSMINSSGRQLLALVGNVLDLERIESGRTELVMDWFSPADTASRLVEMVKPLAESKNLRVRTILSPAVPKTMRTDETKLEQILTNLLTNAIKYCECGTVALDVCADDHTIRFSVSDTGLGIPEEEQDRVFDEFYQYSSQANVAKPVGAGLGLAIVKRLSEMLGGRLTLDSAVGTGSTFTLQLPIDGA